MEFSLKQIWLSVDLVILKHSYRQDRHSPHPTKKLTLSYEDKY